MNFSNALLALTVLVLCIGSSASHAAQGEEATVIIDSLAVHAEMSSYSNVVRHLHRGAVVIVAIETELADGTWCGVKEWQGSGVMGYVQCQFLNRKVRAQQWQRQNPGASKRPYSDVQVRLYLAEW